MSFSPCDSLLRRCEQHCNAQHLCKGHPVVPASANFHPYGSFLGPHDAKNCLGLTLDDKLRQRWPVVVAVDLLVRAPSHSIVITFTTSRIRPAAAR